MDIVIEWGSNDTFFSREDRKKLAAEHHAAVAAAFPHAKVCIYAGDGEDMFVFQGNFSREQIDNIFDLADYAFRVVTGTPD